MRLAWFVVLVSLAVAAPAWGQPAPQDKARQHTGLAAQHYKLGRFQDALDQYSKAYELVPAPALLFNIAQCWRNLVNHERAVFFLEGYLRETKPDAKNRALAQELLVEERRLLEQEQAEARRRTETEEQQRLEGEQRKKARDEEERRLLEARRQREEAEARRLTAEANQKREEDRLWHKWWFWAAAGSVALVAGGTIWYLSPETHTIPPSGSLGTIDHRGSLP
jgi:hypothetical protein